MGREGQLTNSQRHEGLTATAAASTRAFYRTWRCQSFSRSQGQRLLGFLGPSSYYMGTAWFGGELYIAGHAKKMHPNTHVSQLLPWMRRLWQMIAYLHGIRERFLDELLHLQDDPAMPSELPSQSAACSARTSTAPALLSSLTFRL